MHYAYINKDDRVPEAFTNKHRSSI